MINSQYAMGLKTGMVFANPIPEADAADPAEIKAAIAQASKDCAANQISGARRTPFMLKAINEITKGKSSAANVKLIQNNAKLGAQIAVALSKLQKQ